MEVFRLAPRLGASLPLSNHQGITSSTVLIRIQNGSKGSQESLELSHWLLKPIIPANVLCISAPRPLPVCTCHFLVLCPLFSSTSSTSSTSPALAVAASGSSHSPYPDVMPGIPMTPELPSFPSSSRAGGLQGPLHSVDQIELYAAARTPAREDCKRCVHLSLSLSLSVSLFLSPKCGG